MKLFKINISIERIFGLDILRALAIFFVVWGHGTILFPKAISKYLLWIDFDGVSIFFVLSGFLIGGILIKNLEKKGPSIHSLFAFWTRRWLRTLPNYLLVLTFLAVSVLIFSDKFSISTLLKYYIFSQNLFFKPPPFFSESWSLSVEEWFYLLIPIFIYLLIYFVKLSTKKAVLYTALFVLISVTMFRLFRYYTIPIGNIYEFDKFFIKPVFTRLDTLMFGVIGALISYYYNKTWIRYKNQLLFCGIAIFLIIKYFLAILLSEFNLFVCVFTFSTYSFATLCLLPFLSTYKTPLKKNVFYYIFTYLSLISYSLYLINLTTINVINRFILPNYNENSILLIIIKFIVYCLLSISLSILLYKYYEIPMMNLRDKIKLKKRKGNKESILNIEVIKNKYYE